MKRKTIRELVDDLNYHLPEIDYRPSTIERLNADWKKLIAYADTRGIEVFTMELGRAFVWDECGSILGDKDTAHTLNRAIHMLADFEQYGMVFKQSSATLKGFSDEYRQLFEGFLEHLSKTGTADGSIATWKGRLFRFEYFLLSSGVMDFHQIEPQHIFTYAESLSCFASGTIGATIRCLRRLFDYAIQNGRHHTNLVEILPDVRRVQNYRLPTVFTADEVERILVVVDRDNAIGKRNYAILMLVAKLGLRISDARGLRFDSIDWQNKIISIVQKKTGEPLELPLLEDVGWAIIDYLRHGRPQTSCELVFVRHNAPYDGFKDSLQRIVVQYVRKAGIKTPAEKPIGMHTFRHSIATTMLKNGAKYTDIAQTLGHAVPESAGTYLSLDEEQLRGCALEVDF
jgi:site-specific recombinase XerD